MNFRKIYKYKLGPGVTEINLPLGSTFLDVQEQYGNPVAWFLVGTEADGKELRNFCTVPTGGEVDIDRYKYLGTFQLSGGHLVYHLFEEIKE